MLLERGHTDGDAICATIARERPSVLEIVGDVLMRRVARRARRGRRTRRTLRPLVAPTHPQLRRDGERAAEGCAALPRARCTSTTRSVRARPSASGSRSPPRRVRARPRASRSARTRGSSTDDDRDVVPGSGEVGVLAVHTSCAIGYYQDPARSAATFREIDGRMYAHPRRPGDHRRRRHADAPRARLQLHQLGRREDLARGGRGGAQGAPGDQRRGRDGRARRRVGRARRRGRRHHRRRPARCRRARRVGRRAARGLQATAAVRVRRRGRAHHRRQARLRVGACRALR